MLASGGVCLALGLLGLWFVVVRVVARALRPREVVPAAPTMQLGPEPPAVVSLLVHGMQAPPSAAVATLLDLAGRRYLDFYQPGPDPAETLVRVRQGPGPELADFEAKVLERVIRLGAGRNGYARLAELNDRQAEGGFAWAKQFADAVTADAVRRRLAVGRASGAILGMIFLSFAMAGAVDSVLFLGLVPWQALGEYRQVNPLVLGWLLVACVVTWFALYMPMHLLAVSWLPKGSMTAAGRRAAAHWLGVREWLEATRPFRALPPASVTVWDRYLSYGVALDAAPGAVVGLDLDVGRIDVVYADRGGRRTEVVVRYPRLTLGFGLPARARLPWALGVLGFWLLSVVILGRYIAGLGPVAFVFAALAAVQLGRAGYRAVRSWRDVASPVEVVGPVLAVTAANTPSRPASRYYVVIDDGRSATLSSWVIKERFLEASRPGRHVAVTAERWTRCVRAVRAVGGAPVSLNSPGQTARRVGS